MVSPQHFSKYRPLGQVEEMSESEEELIMDELIELASTFGPMDSGGPGYDFAAEEEAAAASWRMTGRDEKKTDLPLAPWGWGKDFDESKLPSGLRLVVEKLQSLAGYPLGPIRDVTVNIRSSDDYQMPGRTKSHSWLVLGIVASHILRQYAQHSYTDDDIDCLVPRRAIYHFAGNARYLWTHAVRPSVAAGDGTFERWGTWDKVLRRGKSLGSEDLKLPKLPQRFGG
eukprot:Skav218960  [mRNA]  locus=scaffold1876:25497:29674:- [translate_table: standard]